jgi:hypothetical protein
MAWLRNRSGGVREGAAVVGAVLTCALAAVSAATQYDKPWNMLRAERARDEVLTARERREAPLTSIPLAAAVFDYYRAFLRPDDRVYFQVLERGFGDFADLPTLVSAAGRFWLLPAVQVADLEDATVVLSWERDPGELGIPFVEQHRSGKQQLFFVSRIARDR